MFAGPSGLPSDRGIEHVISLGILLSRLVNVCPACYRLNLSKSSDKLLNFCRNSSLNFLSVLLVSHTVHISKKGSPAHGDCLPRFEQTYSRKPLPFT